MTDNTINKPLDAFLKKPDIPKPIINKSSSKWKTMFLPLFIPFGISLAKIIFSILVTQFEKAANKDLVLTLDYKLKFLTEIFLYPSISVLVLIFLISMTRMFSQNQKEMVFAEKEGVEKRLLNRILGNTLEQSFIFIPSIIYYLLQQETATNLTKIKAICFVFIIGRVLFAIGYYIGFLNRFIIIRIPGFFITFSATVVAVSWAISFNNPLVEFIAGEIEQKSDLIHMLMIKLQLIFS